jgi:uncharacterized protein (TIGR02147 family)
MKTRSVFEFESYKDAMAHFLSGPERRGQLTRAAESLKCQRSYLSRVITEELHITPDHAFNLARFWKLTPDERAYFQTLVEYERAADPNYKSHLKTQLEELKRKYESIQERTQRASFSTDFLQAGYFSSWIWTALHFLTDVPGFQTIEALSDRLGLKKETITRHLEELEKQDLIKHTKDRWVYNKGEYHVTKDSPLVLLHHQNWRQRALIDAQDLDNKNIHFTMAYALSNRDFERIKEMILRIISETVEIAGPSNPEDVVAFNCDFFRI